MARPGDGASVERLSWRPAVGGRRTADGGRRTADSGRQVIWYTSRGCGISGGERLNLKTGEDEEIGIIAWQ